MPVGVDTPAVSLFLRTFGAPALVRVQHGQEPLDVVPLRRKDLALLVFLCVEERRPHSRGLVASMFWGDTSEERARHSLAQSLSRLRAVLGPQALLTTAECVSWQGPLCSDVALLERSLAEGRVAEWPRAPFLADFLAGHGSAEFEIWAEEKRSYYRLMLLRRLDRLGAEAERGGAWADALAFGQQTVEVDPIAEEGHRRVMRAWSAIGERGLALQHFRSFRRWLRSELEEDPEPLTCALAEELGTPSLDGNTRPSAATGRLVRARPSHAYGWRGARGIVPVPAIGPRRTSPSRGRPRRRAATVVTVTIGALLLVLTPLGSRHWLDADELTVEPADGRPVLVAGEELPRLAFGGSFLRYPDVPTFLACSGWRTGALLREFALPSEAAEATLPSVLQYPALAGLGLVRSERNPRQLYAIVGCVKSPVPDGSVTGPASGTIHELPDSIIAALPTGAPLLTPVRTPGTVIRVRGRSELRWILFGGGALSVPSRRVLASYCRDDVLEVAQSEFDAYKVVGRLEGAQRACGTGSGAPAQM